MNLKPCPFCGAQLSYAAPVAYVHPIGKCILSGRNFSKGYIGQWNKRVSAEDAELNAIADERCFGPMVRVSLDSL